MRRARQHLGDGSHLAQKKVSRKKTLYDPHQKSERVKALRKGYGEALSNLPEEGCVFIDETGATLNLTRTYGRAPTDERVYGEKPLAPGQRISTIGALTSEGLMTALCFEGTLNGAVFLYFLNAIAVTEQQYGVTQVLHSGMFAATA